MLTKKERLTKQEFDRSFSLGKRIHSKELQIIYHPSPTFHAAAVVGKKVYKSAVARNRLRRQLYGAIYRYHKRHEVPGTIIMIAKPAIIEVSQRHVASLVQEQLAAIQW